MTRLSTTSLAAIALFATGCPALSRDLVWNGTWSGLWEEKTQSTMTVDGGKLTEYRMQGRLRPVSDVKLEGDTMTFDVEMNEAISTIVLRKSGGDAKAELVSPGGTRHTGSFAKLGGPAADAEPKTRIDPGVTGSIAPLPAPPPKNER